MSMKSYINDTNLTIMNTSTEYLRSIQDMVQQVVKVRDFLEQAVAWEA